MPNNNRQTAPIVINDDNDNDTVILSSESGSGSGSGSDNLTVVSGKRQREEEDEENEDLQPSAKRRAGTEDVVGDGVSAFGRSALPAIEANFAAVLRSKKEEEEEEKEKEKEEKEKEEEEEEEEEDPPSPETIAREEALVAKLHLQLVEAKIPIFINDLLSNLRALKEIASDDTASLRAEQIKLVEMVAAIEASLPKEDEEEE